MFYKHLLSLLHKFYFASVCKPTNSKYMYVAFQVFMDHPGKVFLALICISLLLYHNYGTKAGNYSNMRFVIQPKIKNTSITTENTTNRHVVTAVGETGSRGAIEETGTYIPGNSTVNKNNCKEQTSHFFLKIAKAGSTCIQNLFWRFGVSRTLSIMVFKKRFPDPSRDFRFSLLSDPKIDTFDGLYHIFCEHSYFNEPALKNKMKKDTQYTASLREPLLRLRSSLAYFGYAKRHHLGTEVDTTEHFLASNKTGTFHQAAIKFGYESSTDTQTFLAYIDSKFKVIVIIEHLDESLVLMKRRYCWKFKDILYLPTRQAKYTTTQDKEKLKELHKLHRERNEIDYLLYEYFVIRHNKQVSAEGNDFAGEVELFMKLSDETKVFCVDVCRQLGQAVSRNASHEQLMEHLSSVVTFPASHWEPAFSVSGLECIMMMLGTGVWRQAQRVTQYPEYCTGEKPDPFFNKVYCNDHFAYSFPWDML